MRQNPHVRICGGPGSATTLVYPTLSLSHSRGPAGRLAATDAAVTRFRTGLEGARTYTLAGRLSLTPSVEVWLPHDGGEKRVDVCRREEIARSCGRCSPRRPPRRAGTNW